eukprot:TRINITY_DN95808_c0_g1_i1.p1 TRINITY_DN95808_c0_g1~~TRINITY_DN95808_c0_g1_i1.p1  ORF type:complete len:177 (-),score=9.72 TRINITY_DN95808_c0_g1_i1:96-572(-)
MDETCKPMTLNVGGQLFVTSKQTLMSREGFLKTLVAGEFGEPARDEQGHIFIDRDPKYFNDVLNVLRGHQPNHSMNKDELLFFNLLESSVSSLPPPSQRGATTPTGPNEKVKQCHKCDCGFKESENHDAACHEHEIHQRASMAVCVRCGLTLPNPGSP